MHVLDQHAHDSGEEVGSEQSCHHFFQAKRRLLRKSIAARAPQSAREGACAPQKADHAVPDFICYTALKV